MSESNAERSLATLIEWHKLPTPMREYPFAKGIGRRWRFDFCWPEHRLAVEVEGGAWIQGRHTRGKGFLEDQIKYGTATVMGWTVLRVGPELVEDGTAIGWIQSLIERLSSCPPGTTR